MIVIGVKDRKALRKTRQPKAKAAPGSKSEHSLHWHVAGLLNKHLAWPAWWTTFPAGGGGEMRGKILKSLGLKAGVPDVLIVVPAQALIALPSGHVGNEWHTVQLLYWIELKKLNAGELSDDQIKTHAKLTAMGCRIAVCDSLESVKETLMQWRLPYQAESGRQAIVNDQLKNAFANV